MSNILLVTSSPRGSASISSKVAIELADKLKAALPGSKVVHHDLVAQPLPHIVPDYASGIYTPPEVRTAAQAELVAVSDSVVDELLAADHVILAMGMVNFSIPSTLKSWIDHISRAGRTFRYDANGPEGLVKGKKVYVVIASGGVYSEGPAAAADFAGPYLKQVLAFNGMTDVEVIRIEGTALGEDSVKKGLADASDRTDAISADLAEPQVAQAA
ncbi:FMN-dependent NADH-azoreductase [Mesorhizobium sp. L-8-10]|uniref:FMN-dependent NADH-azoreductase n=1 Tax=unclassified Mesorhizobium TaxID=325217 RepID=UPI00192831F5|nr:MULTISPECIES: FMN-dependent NADH-azoreductase [unclassified Mesorhizobium]BCH22063.1 FMN-dependent NADH-azoreductase [Mesorhizobium sp. L-8-3]BCH29758.1 FMN-dependent NADH-azoreductase [Mesorhizobium sp. L-8-10]